MIYIYTYMIHRDSRFPSISRPRTWLTSPVLHNVNNILNLYGLNRHGYTHVSSFANAPMVRPKSLS